MVTLDMTLDINLGPMTLDINLGYDLYKPWAKHWFECNLHKMQYSLTKLIQLPKGC